MEVGTVYAFDVPGAPPRKNRRHVLARGRLINGPDFNDLVEVLREAWSPRPTITEGLWRVDIVATWQTRRHLPDVSVPKADVDAPVSSAHDALERARVIDNDIRISELTARREHSPTDPGLRIVLTRVA